MSTTSPEFPTSTIDTDYSKTKAVVRLDLIFKALSAIGLVVLGIVSIRFQAKAEAARHDAEDLEIKEQKYLPLFRGLSEVDVTLEEISAEFGWPTYTHEEADRENRLGTRLAY